MADNDLAKHIATTQETLQPLIAKPKLTEKLLSKPPFRFHHTPTPHLQYHVYLRPKLTEKLLSKPPFRFLHDIITNLIHGTGFAEGLYTPEEIDSANVQEKQQKIEYLDKIINCVGICLGYPIDVRSGKIVAGLEPENTNIFLQTLAQASSDGNIDSAAAVQRTLAGEAPGTGPPAQKGGGRGASSMRDAGAKENVVLAESKEILPPPSESKGVRRESLEFRRGSSVDRGLDAKGGSEGLLRQESGSGGNLVAPSIRSAALNAKVEACNGDFDRTRRMLEGLISRPKATEKLLSKPPFRFLHDIVSEIIRATHFGKGLYTDMECDSSQVTEKAAKIDYLEKIIKLVGMHLNTVVEAKSSKIVAGLEPEKTNRFLQLLMLAATELPDTKNTLRLLLDPGDLSGDGLGQERADTQLPVEDEGPFVPPGNDLLDGRRASAKDEGDKERSSRPAMKRASSKDKNVEGGGSDAEVEAAVQQSAAPLPLGMEDKRSMRPRTARQRPPKVKDNVKEVDVKDAAKATPKTTVVIMRESGEDDKEDIDEDLGVDNDSKSAANVKVDMSEQHGKLVQDIIKEQKRENEAKRKEEQDKKHQNDENEGIRLGRLKRPGLEGKGSTKAVGLVFGEGELESLRNSIQVICQSTNPLGKCMDYVHEDLSAMSKEHDKWESEYRLTLDSLEEQKRVTEDNVQSLRLQLLEVEEQVREQYQKISAAKCSIAQNDERIQQLLRIVVTVSEGSIRK